VVSKFDSPIKLPAPGESFVVQGEWAWDECYFASVLILQPPLKIDADGDDPGEEPPDTDGAMGIGAPLVGKDPKNEARTIWQLALNRLPGAAPLVAGKAQASALAVGSVNGKIKAVAWTNIVDLDAA